MILVWIVPEGLDCSDAASSQASSSGMVHELTIEADRRLALEDDDPEDTDETVDMVEIGDMVEVRPDRELRPESELE